MRKALFLLVAGSSLYVNGQNTYPGGTGTVGLGTAPFTADPYRLHLRAPQSNPLPGEMLLHATVDDSPNQHLSITNVASGAGLFLPMLWGSDERPTPAAGTRHAGLYIRGNAVDDTNDAGTLNPILTFNATLNYSPTSGVSNAVAVRPLFSWSNQYVTHMIMAANGNLGIGTGSVTAPTARLHTSGSVRHQGLPLTSHPEAVVIDANGNLARRAWPTGGATLSCGSGNYIPKVTGVNTMGCSQIWDNGSLVTINTVNTSVMDPSIRFKINGNMQVLSAYWSSDARLKNEVVGLQGSLDRVMRLNPVAYTWKKEARPDHQFDDLQHQGFLAQELKKVIPSVVLEDTEGFMAVNYVEIIPELVGAIQDQQEIIADKQAQIDALTQRMDQLEASLNVDGQDGSSARAGRKPELFQNAPNPFNENTVIRYCLTEQCGKCGIEVMDMNGRIVTTFNNLAAGQGQLMIAAGVMNAGTYTYTLIVNGERADTKSMIITR